MPSKINIKLPDSVLKLRADSAAKIEQLRQDLQNAQSIPDSEKAPEEADARLESYQVAVQKYLGLHTTLNHAPNFDQIVVEALLEKQIMYYRLTVEERVIIDQQENTNSRRLRNL